MNLHPVRYSHQATPISPVPVIKPDDAMQFSEWVSRYEQRMLHAALQVLRSESAALKATETAFMRAWRRMGTPHTSRPDLIWMYRVLIDACMDQIRPQEQQSQPVNEALSSACVSPLPPKGAPASAALLSRMDQAITEMAPRRRIVFVLAHYEALTFRQIGDVLDITAACARVTYHAALLELYDKLGANAVGELRAHCSRRMADSSVVSHLFRSFCLGLFVVLFVACAVTG